MKQKDTRYLNGKYPDRKAQTYHDITITDVVSKHYAANGRTVTACGKKIEFNSNTNHADHSNRGDPTCVKCQRVMKLAKLMDPASLVALSEDNSRHALSTVARALKDAQILCEQLPPGFQPLVWYNGHWYYSATTADEADGKPTLHVNPNFIRYVNAPPKLDYYLAQVKYTHHIGRDKNPKKAIRLAIDSFKVEAAKTILDLTHLSNMLAQVAP